MKFLSGYAGLWIPLLICFSIFWIARAEANDWRSRIKADQEINREDINEELIFGREVAARMLGKYKLYENPVLQKYVALAGNTVALNTNRPEVDFHFAILDTADINAYAAPGGFVFITKGALMIMQDEAELSGVLAHEIAHITERHIVKELNIHGTEASTASTLSRAIGGAGFESAKIAFYQTVDKAMNILFSDGYKREDEVQADMDAVIYCILAGYDPSGLSRYLKRAGSAGEKKTDVLDRTHPGHQMRADWIQKTIRQEGAEAVKLKENKARFLQTMKESGIKE
jgi:predicted Zn-dependent protease